MTPNLQQALNTLQQTGKVSLPGAQAVWSSTQRMLWKVLLVMIAVVAIGGPVALFVLGFAGTGIGFGTIFGMVTGIIMLVGVVLVVRYGARRHKTFQSTETQPVIIDARGLTMRGIGPIPWADFGPAHHGMVPAEQRDGYVRRAVMELTPSGLYNVNERTAPEMRIRISPPAGPFWNQRHRYVYLPGVEGLREQEVIELINTGHRLYGGTVRT